MVKILIIKHKDLDVGSMQDIKKEHLDLIKKVLPSAEVKILSQHEPTYEVFLKTADIIIAPSKNSIDYASAINLKWIHFTSAGAVIPEILKNSKVQVTSSSGVHPIPIAEHVMAFMLMFARQINIVYRREIGNANWDRKFDELNILEINGKTIGIIGLGKIGSKVAQYAKAFGMQTLGVVRNVREKPEWVDKLVDNSQLSEILKTADFIVNCLPGTKETFHLFNLEKFKQMKKTSYFINIGRGTSVDEADLITALNKKYISGAGLDVFETEPLPEKSSLWRMENVIITPHYSGWTPFYMDRVIDIFCENLKAYLNNKKLPNEVDKELGY